MLSDAQKNQIEARGISVDTFGTQLENFKTGFPFLTIEAAATPAKGIKVLSAEDQAKYISVAENYKGNVCKFVPASGAATRMFKDLFEAADAHCLTKHGIMVQCLRVLYSSTNMRTRTGLRLRSIL